MAISFVNATNAIDTGTAGQTLNIILPTCVDNDFLILPAACRNTAPVTPAGWSLQFLVVAGGNRGHAVYTKFAVAASDSGATLTFDQGAAVGRQALVAACYRGVDLTNPLDVAAAQPGSVAGTTVTAPQVTTVTANARILSVFLGTADGVGGGPFTAIAPVVSRGAAGSALTGRGNAMIGDPNADQAVAGASTQGTATVSTTYTPITAATLALRPSGGAVATRTDRMFAAF